MTSDCYLDVLIITTAHSAEDGRLIRHQKSLKRSGLNSRIICVLYESRFERFFLAPIRVYKTVKALNPRCVLLPDPELHLLVTPLLSRNYAVISDVHEDYLSVLEDRKWIKALFKPLLKTLLKILPKVRDRFSDQVIVASSSLVQSSEVVIENIPHIDDLSSKERRERMRAVYVGDIRSSRGLERMFSLLLDIPGLYIDLIGPCSEEDRLSELIEEHQLQERVIWHGRLPYEESWRIASKSSVGLCLLESTPAFDKAIPSKIWEYWALGLPVITSELAEMSSLIRKVNGGFVLDGNQNVEELRMWLGDDDELLESGKRGQAFFESESLKNTNNLSDVVSHLIE